MRVLIIIPIVFFFNEAKTQELSKLHASSQDKSWIRIDSGNVTIQNVKYSLESVSKNGNIDRYIVKSTNNIRFWLGPMGHVSEIKLDLLDMKNSKPIWTVSKSADEVNFGSRFLHSATIGCCGAEVYNEFSTYWTDHTFLSFNNKYYLIEVPNAHLGFYFGYLTLMNQDSLTHGELYLIQERLQSNREWAYKEVGRIKFKARTKEEFDKLIPFTPEMKLVKNTDKDELFDNNDNQELRLWSFNNAKGLMGLNFTGLRIQFNGTPLDVPIKNGYLFGDSINHRKTMYIDR